MTRNLQLRFTKKQDYLSLSDWWDWWRWKHSKPSIELLDNLKFGMMVSNQTQDICAGFIYFTNANAFCLMEYIISNPAIKDREQRHSAIVFLICSLQEFAKKQGVKVIFSSVKNPNLIKTYQECGFSIGSTSSTEMICKL